MRYLAHLAFAASLVCCTATTAVAAVSHDEHPDWRTPRAPFRIFGNTWYVGTEGLAAILVTSSKGHILIDGTLPENARLIEASIRSAGFRLHDVRVILNTHAHGDHAGGIAQLAHDTGATVVARAAAQKALRSGGRDPEDPQYGGLTFPQIARLTALPADGHVRVGPLDLAAHATPGHTPGGTSWTWRACQDGRCVDIAYVDSLTAISRKGFRYTDDAGHPHRVEDFNASFDTVKALPCEVLVTPHPEASDLMTRVAAHEKNTRPDPLFDASACKAYADKARAAFEKRLADERAGTL